MFKLPKNWTDPKIVLGYNDEIRLMVSLPEKIIKNWGPDDSRLLAKKKVEYLEDKIGYSILPMEKMVSHDGYEEIIKKTKLLK